MTPKVLVISNECFSKTSSNGRTLGNFFVGWQKDCLAQFFLSGKPDSYYCDRYFQVSDRQALNALIGRGNIGGAVEEDKLLSTEDEATAQLISGGKKTRRNALTMLFRDAIWKSNRWKKSGYAQWVNSFNPDIVLLQAGDCAFMYMLAVETAKQNNAKLVIYNSEGYYYKDFDYFQGKGIAHIVYPIFQKRLKKALKEAYAMASCVIYICDELKEQYAKDFSVRAETVFTGSEIKYEEKAKKNTAFTTVYCGNLGLKRHESLIDIANVLQSISGDLFVDVYGNANDDVITAFNNCKGIRYHGLIPYEQVKQKLRDSDLLLYVESFDEFYQEDIKFGFSTKIADSLSSGNCFLLYAPEHFASYRYLKNNNVAYTASNEKELEDILKDLVTNPDSTEKYKSAALEIAAKNHSVEKNNKKFQNILREIAD